MLFGRRNPFHWKEKLRVAVWPRRSWSRSVSYIMKRILRLTASPHAVAAGVAAGVFSAFTPFMGLHVILALVIAWLIAGNLVAAALGTLVGNPVTFPIIWGATWEVGHVTAPGAQPHAAAAGSGMHEIGLGGLLGNLPEIWEPLLKPMTIGAIPLGLFFSLIAYFSVRWLAARFRRERHARIAARAARANA
jgi:hypothetical protein